jgi:hypothetical protein
MDRASVLLIPITEGSGSNLKTAQALLSGKSVLTTSIGMRGYESYSQLQNLHIEDDPKRFKAKLAELLTRPEPAVSRDSSLELTWERVLKRATNWIQEQTTR